MRSWNWFVGSFSFGIFEGSDLFINRDELTGGGSRATGGVTFFLFSPI